MCVGLPSCVSDVDGMPEAVTHGVNGCVCALDDLDDWTDHLSRLAGDREARRRMGRRALKLAETRFSMRRMAEETLAVYEAVLSGRPIESGRAPR
jgi:1,4-alpha-glucan branching enzyme